MHEPGDVTIASYHAAADVYRADEAPLSGAVRQFLDRVARLVGNGRLLELGSGTGRDADYLEGLGVAVIRTDATPAFVAMLRDSGHDATLLDARRDDLGGPYDGILAMATLLHVIRGELFDLLLRARHAVRSEGVLAFTMKEGDREAWSDAKLGRPRYFVYWREPELRTTLQTAGWTSLSVDRVMGRSEPWLLVTAKPTPHT